MPARRLGFRFSLLTLLAFMTLLGLGLASLLKASPLLVSAWFTFVVLFLTAATLAAVFRRGTNHMSWRGFVITGWICIIVTFSPLLSQQVPPPLLTSQGLLWLDDFLTDEEAEPRELLYTTGHNWWPQWESRIRLWNVNSHPPSGLRAANFQQIGQCILTVLFAFAGGAIARFLSTGDG